MCNRLSEQFDVLSNALRIFPEELLRLNYFLHKVNDPEEGISNIETACFSVFNQIYGMMCALKDSGHIKSIYEQDAITTLLCIRHVLQHKSGRIKNNLRDGFNKQVAERIALVNYGASDAEVKKGAFYINASWIQDGIRDSNNANRLSTINSYLCLDLIKTDLERLSISMVDTYLCVLPLITEAARELCTSYGSHFRPVGFDSDVYYTHFLQINKIDTRDYEIIT